jgi:acetyltransferase-like isoleucine patch superfamily enzyme
MRISYYWAPRMASALRRLRMKVLNPHVDFEIGPHVYFGPGFSLYAPYGGSKLVIGEGVEFRRGFRIELEPGAEVRIGAHTRFTYYVLVQCGQRIEIGERCVFAQSTMVVDGNHRFRDLSTPMLHQGYDYRPVIVEDDVSILAKCTIVGCRIGTRTVVGANSVVSRDLPAYTVAVGAPARPIDYFGPEGSEPPELTASRSSR